MSLVLSNNGPAPHSINVRAGSPQKRLLPYPSTPTRKLIEIRPKGSLVVTTAASTALEMRRQQHADVQKCQRDRMKAALDRMARLMEMGGVDGEGTSGTKAQLLETAVEYIQYLQGQVAELRGSREFDLGCGHATRKVDLVSKAAQEGEVPVD